MAVMCKKKDDEEVFAQLQGCAPVLLAFMECSDDLQKHAKEMLKVFLDPNSNDDDRFLAGTTLADILFPNTHEGDKMLGMDLQEAEAIARQQSEPSAVLTEMDREEETFAARLEALMQEHGISQTELARRIGIGQSAISMMLKRECRPQKRTVIRIADALTVKPEDLWPGFGKVPGEPEPSHVVPDKSE